MDDPTNCRTCHCSRGNFHCVKQECPRVQCRHPITDGCCPKCTDCRYHNRRYRDEETFTNLQDPCQSCTCSKGTVQCEHKACPLVTCQHPVHGRCCQECGNCFYQNRRFHDGQIFSDMRSTCNECTCTGGTVVCHVRSCPVISCSNPSQGKCCPECRDCVDGGVVIANGHSIQRGPCEECACRNGNIQCQQKQCPNAVCRNPVQRECCLECSSCSYNGEEYTNGAMFVNPEDICQDCTCSDGNVYCKSKACPPVRCNSPVQGECCPICTSCLYRNRHYSDGDTFPDESDQCGTCTCRKGDIECVSDQCPPASCSHPVQTKCCKECDSCYYRNRIYSDGDRFEDNCQDCVCMKGDIRCIPSYCPHVSCTNPVKDGCCYSCTDCMFEDRQIRNGQRLPHLRDPCSECICRVSFFFISLSG